MKTTRAHRVVVTLLAVALATFSAISSSVAKPPSGDEIIRKVQKTYEKMDTFSASFRQEFQWGLAGETEVSEGSMLLAGDDRFLYQTDHQVVACDGNTLWRYNTGSDQAIVENAAEADPGSLPRDFLFDFPKQFNVAAVKQTSEDVYELTLSPKQQGLGVSDVTVTIDGTRWITQRISFRDDAGNQTVYQLTDVEMNVQLEDSRFQYTPPESATVFDLR